MILFTGRAEAYKATLFLFGDGQSDNVTIDFSKTPFEISFDTMPSKVSLDAEQSVGLRSAKLTDTKLALTFQSPLPSTNFDYAVGQVGVPRTELEVFFLYEEPPVR